MAARKKTAKKASSGGRGSKEAIEKRRAARQLNTLLTGGSRVGNRLDGRTENRRKRLVKELKEGRGGRPLKPIDFVHHVDELIRLGESVGSLRKQGVRARKTEPTPEILAVVEQTQKAYHFHPDAWKLLGLPVTATRAKKARGRKRG